MITAAVVFVVTTVTVTSDAVPSSGIATELGDRDIEMLGGGGGGGGGGVEPPPHAARTMSSENSSTASAIGFILGLFMNVSSSRIVTLGRTEVNT